MSAKVIPHPAMLTKPELEQPFPIGNWEGSELEVVPDVRSPISKMSQKTTFTLSHLVLKQANGKGALRVSDGERLNTEELVQWIRERRDIIMFHFHPSVRIRIQSCPHVFRIRTELSLGRGILEIHIGIAEEILKRDRPEIWKIFEEYFSGKT